MIKVRSVSLSGDYRCYCPLHDDKKASLSINVKKNAAICFAGCFEGRAIDLIAQVERLPKITAWRKMMENKVFDFSERDDDSGAYEPSTYERIRNNGLVWSPGDYTLYLRNRGFSRGTIRLWDIEYCSDIQQIRIPVCDRDGAWRCYSYRTTRLEGDDPKYIHPGFRKRQGWLFGENMFSPHRGIVNVVEGPLDCIWMWQNGFMNTIAFLGTPSAAQIKRIPEFGDKITLCLDNDDAGRNNARRIYKAMQPVSTEIAVLDLPKGVKDVQDVTGDNLRELILRRRRV